MTNWKDSKFYWRYIALGIIIYILPSVVFGILVGTIKYLGYDIIKHFTWILSIVIVLIPADYILKKVIGEK